MLTKTVPFTIGEIEKLKKTYDFFIKTVIDVEESICSAGMEWHYQGEQLLLNQGSKQSNIWGGGIDLKVVKVTFNAFINIRPNDNNDSNEILDQETRKKYEELTKFFFKAIF